MKFAADTPSSSIANLEYVPACKVAPPTNVILSAPGAVLDGVTMVLYDRVLLTAQNIPSENGFWDYISSAAPMTRSQNILIVPGMLAPVSEGSTNGDRLFQLTTDAPIVLGTTALTFALFVSGVGTVPNISPLLLMGA